LALTQKYKNFANLDDQSNYDIRDYHFNKLNLVRKVTVVSTATRVSHKPIYTFI